MTCETLAVMALIAYAAPISASCGADVDRVNGWTRDDDIAALVGEQFAISFPPPSEDGVFLDPNANALTGWPPGAHTTESVQIGRATLTGFQEETVTLDDHAARVVQTVALSP